MADTTKKKKALLPQLPTLPIAPVPPLLAKVAALAGIATGLASAGLFSLIVGKLHIPVQALSADIAYLLVGQILFYSYALSSFRLAPKAGVLAGNLFQIGYLFTYAGLLFIFWRSWPAFAYAYGVRFSGGRPLSGSDVAAQIAHGLTPTFVISFVPVLMMYLLLTLRNRKAN
jgi:hypothetical protein